MSYVRMGDVPERLLLGSRESDGSCTCSSVNAQQADRSGLIVQGLKALGGAIFGGELQNIVDVLLLVSVLVTGDDNALAGVVQ